MKKLLATIAASALLVGACGGSGTEAPAASDDAKAQFTSAVEALGSAAGQTITFSLDSDVASLQALAKDDGDDLAEADAQKILGSSIRISAKNTTDPAEAAAAIVINVAGNDAVELRTVGNAFYARFDAARLMETFGQNPADLDSFAKEAAAANMGFVKDAIDGRWLAIEGLAELAQGMTGQPTEPTAEQAALYGKFLDTLKTTTEVGSEGDDAIGTHLVATFQLRDLYRGLVELTSGLGQTLPTGLPPESEVPDETIYLDVWVNDGKIVQVSFDFLQLAEIEDEEVPEGVDKLAIKLTLADFSGEVEVPADAVTVDPTAIFGSLFGGMPMGGKTGSGGYGAGEFPCEMLEGEPREVLEQFKEECPELLKK